MFFKTGVFRISQISQKRKTFFKKLEYRFSVERTKIEKASSPYKTAISEANVKTNGNYKKGLSQRTKFYK